VADTASRARPLPKIEGLLDEGGVSERGGGAATLEGVEERTPGGR